MMIVVFLIHVMVVMLIRVAVITMMMLVLSSVPIGVVMMFVIVRMAVITVMMLMFTAVAIVVVMLMLTNMLWGRFGLALGMVIRKRRGNTERCKQCEG
ncbi:hypothetical protein R0135_12935 [Congregibacter variabilis]|uniref:ABC transmembrane type-1 domain-containing protein n=1 Tax=Congregibacter variabilis TaxID=3081200 RepID=A0ABZ0I1I7_9GAMM|nr:hypothetical protein R0135_12935 [Congregibacter sp. IMCC43200]